MNIKKCVWLIISSFFLLIITVPAFTEDLWQVYLQACASDPLYKAAAATYLANKENLPISRAALLPTIAAAGSTEWQQITATFPTGVGTGAAESTFSNTQNQYAITATQPVFNYGFWMAVKSASAFVKQAEATFFAAQQDLIIRTAQAYFAVLQAKDNLTYLMAQRQSVGHQLARAKQQFAVGIIAITDVYNAQASYDVAVANEIAAKNTLANKLVELRAITNVRYMSLLGVGNRLPLMMPEPNDMTQWLNTSERQNYALLAQRYATQVAQANIKVQFAGHLPTVNADAGYTEQHNTNLSNSYLFDAKTANVGLSATLPIYQGGLINAQTEQADYLYQQAIAQMEQTHRGVLTQTSEAYLGILSSISKTQADQQAVISSERSLEATQSAYSVGTRSITDLLDAESALYQARNTYSQDEYTYLLNILSLKEAAGTLSPGDLKQINSWLTHHVDLSLSITGAPPEEAVEVQQTVPPPQHAIKKKSAVKKKQGYVQ